VAVRRVANCYIRLLYFTLLYFKLPSLLELLKVGSVLPKQNTFGEIDAEIVRALKVTEMPTRDSQTLTRLSLS